MAEAPLFFVPEASPEIQEATYAGLAASCECAVPSPDRRVYSITFDHDKDEWIATVGESLRGSRLRVTRSKGKRVERVRPLHDPAVVLAIFSSDPFMVVTNHQLPGNVGSDWVNPFMAGSPKSVTYFSVR